MGDYAYKKEKERKAAEEAARKLAQEEADKLLAKAIESEDDGDMEASKSALLDAEIAETASKSISIDFEKPKVKGASSQLDWEIESIDESKVPISVGDVIIRPVDESSIMRLIRASKGSINIQGIKYHETIKMSFRRS